MSLNLKDVLGENFAKYEMAATIDRAEKEREDFDFALFQVYMNYLRALRVKEIRDLMRKDRPKDKRPLEEPKEINESQIDTYLGYIGEILKIESFTTACLKGPDNAGNLIIILDAINTLITARDKQQRPRKKASWEDLKKMSQPADV